MEPKRLPPRSPRTALQPDYVPAGARPVRPSRRARRPMIIIGNALMTLLILVLIVAGGAVVMGKSRLETAGPLPEDKIVTIPPRSGIMDIAELLTQEGVIEQHRWIFLGGAVAL